MLILSQDKTNIINLENIIGIGINNNYINIRSVDGYVLNLGEYATEERAKEVLQEIIEAYSKEDFYHIRKSELNNLDSLEEPKYIIKPVIRNKVYEIPEK